MSQHSEQTSREVSTHESAFGTKETHRLYLAPIQRERAKRTERKTMRTIFRPSCFIPSTYGKVTHTRIAITMSMPQTWRRLRKRASLRVSRKHCLAKSSSLFIGTCMWWMLPTCESFGLTPLLPAHTGISFTVNY